MKIALYESQQASRSLAKTRVFLGTIKILGTANGNRTRILALKGLRANRCTIAALCCGVTTLLEYGKFHAATSCPSLQLIAKFKRRTAANDGPSASSQAASTARRREDLVLDVD